MEGFEYVVNPVKKPRLAFGTTLEREVMPVNGPNMTSFMRTFMIDRSRNPGPTDYKVEKTLDRNFPSKLGFSSFASALPRLISDNLAKNPPVDPYDFDKPKVFKQTAKPFNVGSRRIKEDRHPTPGPATYSYHEKTPDLKICSAFGSRRIIYPAVAIFCARENTFACSNCGKLSPSDFWHNFDTDLNLCFQCVKQKYCANKTCKIERDLSRKVTKELNGYSPARYCGFYHSHEGNNMAVANMSRKALRNRITLENYLYRYSAKTYFCRPK